MVRVARQRHRGGKKICLLSHAFLNVEKNLLDLEGKGITVDREKTNSLKINVKIDKMFKMNKNIEEVNKFLSVGSVVTSPVGVE